MSYFTYILSLRLIGMDHLLSAKRDTLERADFRCYRLGCIAKLISKLMLDVFT